MASQQFGVSHLASHIPSAAKFESFGYVEERAGRASCREARARADGKLRDARTAPAHGAEAEHNHMQTKLSIDGASSYFFQRYNKDASGSSSWHSKCSRVPAHGGFHGDGSRACMDRRHLQCQPGRVRLVRVIRLRACLCQHPNCFLRQRCLLTTQSRKYYRYSYCNAKATLSSSSHFLHRDFHCATACMYR